MIKYIGSKRVLVPRIVGAIRRLQPLRGEAGAGLAGATVLDVFSGTSRVGHALKGAGYRVIACDHNAYAARLAMCYVQADLADVERRAVSLISEFNRITPSAGYFTRTFCQRSRYVQEFNGEKIDAIRRAITRRGLEPELEAVVLTSLVEAADRVDSTTGLQMAYLKRWSARSANPIELRMPAVLPRASSGKGAAHQVDAMDAARLHEVDVAYVDPPYNQHSYLGNYHVWETLVLGDEPETYGVACKRIDCKERRSVFNSKRHGPAALKALLGAISARAIVASFSDEGFVTRAEMEAMLGGLFGGSARVRTIAIPSQRYVGARIGIHSPSGEKVGQVSHVTNTEFLYVVRPGAARDRGRVTARCLL
jgi:adenine-specific DNA-methyltransferase